MADYISQFTGGEIDARLRKVSELEAEKQDALVSGENIKTVGGQSVLGSGDIPVGDENAVKFTPQTLTDAQKAQARANIDAVSLADIENMDFVTATSLPTASASTMGHIYLIGPDANDNYDRYFTQESGGSYSWVPLGSTQIDLSTYATKAEVDELEAKVDGLEGFNSGSIPFLFVLNSYLDKTNGSFLAYTGWKRTGYVNIALFSQYKITTTLRSEYNAYYDANKAFISSFTLVAGDNSIRPPKNAVYMVLSNTNAAMNATTIEIVGREAYETRRISSFKMGYYSNIGKIITSLHADWTYKDFNYCPDYIPVTPGQRIVWNNAVYKGGFQSMIFYNSAKEFLVAWSSVVSGTVLDIVPSGAAFVRITFGLTMPDSSYNYNPLTVGGIPYLIDDLTLATNAKEKLLPEISDRGIMGKIYPEEVLVVERELEYRFEKRFHFIHISDNHGGTFGNAQEYLDLCPAKFLVNTGDLVANKFEDKDLPSFKTMELALEPTKPVFLVLGNHDYYLPPSMQAVFDAFIAPTNAHNGTSFDKTYYSMDYPTEGVRFIVLDDNDGWTDEEIVLPSTFDYTAMGKMSSGQINWLISELQDASSNQRHVIIFVHVAPRQIDRKFRVNEFCDAIDIDTSSALPFLPEIIDAFIDGGTASFEYEGNNYTATFSRKGHFVAWCCGHQHGDQCGWMDGHENQFISVVPQPGRNNGIYGATYDGDKLGVHWNYCTIDPVSKCFSVYRMGQQTTVYGTPRVAFNVYYK